MASSCPATDGDSPRLAPAGERRQPRRRTSQHRRRSSQTSSWLLPPSVNGFIPRDSGTTVRDESREESIQSIYLGSQTYPSLEPAGLWFTGACRPVLQETPLKPPSWPFRGGSGCFFGGG